MVFISHHCRNLVFFLFTEFVAGIFEQIINKFQGRAWVRAMRNCWAKNTELWVYLTIIPRARMGSELIAHEAAGVLVKSNWLVKNIENKKILAT